MTIADIEQMAGRTYPARRLTRNLVGGASPIQAENFSMGFVVLEPNGGQVPWHNQEQEEVYFVVEGTGEQLIDQLRTGTPARTVRHVHAAVLEVDGANVVFADAHADTTGMSLNRP